MSVSADGKALEQLLSRKLALEASVSCERELSARIRELRHWQAARLAGTYGDFAHDPRHAKAIAFFLTDLYGPHDFARRDTDLIGALNRMRRTLPRALLELLAMAVELDVITSELDRAVAQRLAPGAITASAYAAAYRAAGKRDARQRQIELIVAIGAALERVVRRPAVGLALRVAHFPAHALGFGALQDSLERGFAAFRDMNSAEPLLGAIRERETRLSEAIFRDDAAALEPLQRGAAT